MKVQTVIIILKAIQFSKMYQYTLKQGCRSQPFLKFPAPAPAPDKFRLRLLVVVIAVVIAVVIVVVARPSRRHSISSRHSHTYYLGSRKNKRFTVEYE